MHHPYPPPVTIPWKKRNAEKVPKFPYKNGDLHLNNKWFTYDIDLKWN